MIEIQNLTRRFGKKVAVDNLTFTVEDGEIIGFLGPNGAGKSTTMNMITGYIGATSGTILIDGHNVLEHPMEAKKCIGYLPEQPPLYMDMTVEAYLAFVYDLKKVRLDKAFHLSEVMDKVGITEVRTRRIKNLSKGYRQRVGLGQALIGYPEVLILDEPTVGLDPKQIIEIRTVIRSLAAQHTIILSSHILTEISAICDRVIILNHGKIVAMDTMENLSRRLSGDRLITARIEGDGAEVQALLESVDGVRSVTRTALEDGSSEYRIETDLDVRKEISVAVATGGYALTQLLLNEMSLEDIFMTLTEEEGGKDDASDFSA